MSRNWFHTVVRALNVEPEYIADLAVVGNADTWAAVRALMDLHGLTAALNRPAWRTWLKRHGRWDDPGVTGPGDH